MARLLPSMSTTDGASLGSPSVVDNLFGSNKTMGVFTLRRNADTSQIGIAGKSTALLTSGWTFFADNGISPNTTYGHLRMIVGTSGVPLARSAGATDSATDAMVLDAHEIVGFTWDGDAAIANANCKLFRAPIDEWISEVSGYNDVTTPTGTVGADASADLSFLRSDVVGASETKRSWSGDGGLCLLYNRATAYTVEDMRRVQIGVWAYLDAVEHGTSTARAVAILQSVSGYVVLGYLASDGTWTDHTSNTSITLTGTSAGTDDTNWFVRSEFDDDREDLYASVSGGDLREQFDYRYTSSHARQSFVTAATAGTVLFHRTLDGTYDDQGVIGLLVNDAYSATLSSNGSVGRQRATFSGLSGSSKTVTLQNGCRSAPGARPYEGTFLVAVRLNAAATVVAPTTSKLSIVCIGDSVLDGFLLNPPQEDAPIQQLRISGFSPTYTKVVSLGAGGLSLFDIAGDSTKRAAYAAILTDGNPRRILIQLGANDQISGASEWDVDQFETGLDALCAAILAVSGFSGRITLATITDWGAGLGGANGNGDTIEDFRQAIRDVVTSQASSRVALCEIANGLLTPATDLDADGVHLNITGANKLRPVYQDFTSDLDVRSATVAGTLGGATEANVRAGGRTITVTVAGTTWIPA